MQDPRIGNLSKQDAQMLKGLAQQIGGFDCMPFWMRAEIEKKLDNPSELIYSSEKVKTMKLHKALKVKNRLTGEVNRLQGILNRENARRNDNVSQVNREEVFNSLQESRKLLVEIRGKIAVATAPIAVKLVEIEELKSYVNFLNSVSIKEGKEVAFVGRNEEKLEYVWESFLNREKVDKMVKDIQDFINGLQDEVDDYNARTDIDF